MPAYARFTEAYTIRRNESFEFHADSMKPTNALIARHEMHRQIQTATDARKRHAVEEAARGVTLDYARRMSGAICNDQLSEYDRQFLPAGFEAEVLELCP